MVLPGVWRVAALCVVLAAASVAGMVWVRVVPWCSPRWARAQRPSMKYQWDELPTMRPMLPFPSSWPAYPMPCPAVLSESLPCNCSRSDEVSSQTERYRAVGDHSEEQMRATRLDTATATAAAATATATTTITTTTTTPTTTAAAAAATTRAWNLWPGLSYDARYE